LRRHFKVHQKSSANNKLSPEDRLRCVKKLMQKTDSILTGPNKGHHEDDQPVGHEQRRYISQHKRQSNSVKHYRHYFILPAIQGNQSDKHDSLLYTIGDNALTVNPFLPPTYPYDSSADPNHAYDYNYSSSFVSFGIPEYNNLQYSGSSNYLLQSENV
jgi:hypothetical protein